MTDMADSSTHWSRVVSLQSGVAMVVTDLHGDWDLYRRYRDRFLQLQAGRRADYLVFTGDLIHSEGPAATDRSLDILLDVLRLRQALSQRLIYLLGNHELPHLYGIPLARGEHVYTPRLEGAMGAQRSAILALLERLPVFVRTRGGVSICHAGAAAELCAPGAAARVFDYSHQQVRQDMMAQLPDDEGQRASMRAGFARLNGDGASYDELAHYYLAVSGPEDPRYDDLLVGFLAASHPDFALLWATLFNRNELDYGAADYGIFVDALLRELSAEFCPQEVLVTGHIPCRGGYTVVVERQLRVASGRHAHPPRSARYLLLDTAQQVSYPDALLDKLAPVW